MKIIFRIPASLQVEMLEDLARSHEYAFERVGFLYTTQVKLSEETSIVLAQKYVPVRDEDYIEDSSVGARINSNAIRGAMQHVLDNQVGCFHVHLHNHEGRTGPSSTDKKGIPGVVQSMGSADPKQLHGYLILSRSSAFVEIYYEDCFIAPERAVIVGYPMNFILPSVKSYRTEKRYNRQSFLGKDAQFLLENVRVGIVGYGGGGSHIGQQLAHLGVKNVTIFDDDKVEDTNLNRLVGAWFSDVKKRLLKVKVAERIFRKLIPKNEFKAIDDKWQNKPEWLQQCDIILGGVDTYSERQQLEAECRRYLIPYIDIGMDVNTFSKGPYMSGQVILSMPGMSCMFCMGFLTDEKLGKEAARYGDIGGRPQVVWSNGVLASTAVGVFIDIVSGWTNQKDKRVYLAYDGNLCTLTEHARLEYSDHTCTHYPLDNTGRVRFRQL